MTRVPGETFRNCLAGLDPGELAAFVAAVYDARGWETDGVGDDGDVLVTPPGAERPQRLAVRRDDDATVSLHDGGDATTLDPTDLRRMVLYAVDDESRTRLFRTFFDRDPETVELPTPTDDGDDSRETHQRPRPAGDDSERDASAVAHGGGSAAVDATPATTDDESERDAGDAGVGTTGTATEQDTNTAWSTTRVLAVGLAVALVVGGLAAAVGPGLTSSPGGADGGAVESDGAAATETATVQSDDSSNVMDREGRPIAPGVIKVATVPEPKPPGVGTTGVTNVSALTAAHAAALSNRSYRLTITHREFVGGDPTGFVRERSVVANATRYRTDLQWVGIVRGETRAVRNTSVYADGRARYVRRGDENRATVETELRPDRDRVARRTGAYLRETVAGGDTEIVGAFERNGTVRFWITVGRDDAGTSTSILVDENGLVRELHHEYTYRPADGSPVRVVVTMHATPSNVSVSAPAWVADRQ